MNQLIGAKIKSLREQENYSQEYVAVHLNISQPTLARIEAGKTSSWVNHINKIIELFNIEAVELLIPDYINILNKNKDSDKKDALLTDDVMNKLINQYEDNIKLKDDKISGLEFKLQECKKNK